MSMVKRGVSNVSAPVQMVQDTFVQGDMKCQECGEILDIASSQNGIILCPKGHKNHVQDMEK